MSNMFSLLTMTTQILAHVNVLAKVVEDTDSFAGQTHVRQLRIPGDLIIGGVFPVHAKGSAGSPCGEIFETRGVHRVEAMLYALDLINSQTDFLRGYRLGALILDSCSNPAFALNQSLDFVRDMIGSADLGDYHCSDGRKPTVKQAANRKSVVAVVGASYSSVTVQIANLLRLFRIVQVSPASTNADLSDKSRFEYFARTVPSDNYQARAMIDIASRFSWTYISLVYSADEYGELGADAFKKEARRAHICIAIEERLVLKPESLNESIDNLVKKLQPDKEVGARVVVLFVGSEYIAELMQKTSERMEAGSINNGGGGIQQKKIIWLASEGWDRNNLANTQGPRKLAAEGAIVLMLESQRVPSFEEYFLSLQPGTERFERNQWLRELWRYKYGCEFDLPTGSTMNRCEAVRQSAESFNPDDKVLFVVEAVQAIAHALQAMKEEVCPNDSIETSWISRASSLPNVCDGMRNIDGGVFYNYLLKVKFADLVGKRVHFSKEGDGPAHYTVLNFQPSSTRPKTQDSDRGDYVEVGRWSMGDNGSQLEINETLMFWNVEGGDGKVPISRCSSPCEIGYKKQLIKLDEHCCWACGKCEDYEYLINETTCLDCGEGHWPTVDRKGCYDLSINHLKHMRWSSLHSIIPIVFASSSIAITLIVIAIYILHDSTPIVKASGRELSYIMLVGMLLCHVMTFVLVAPPSTLTCALKRSGIGFAFSCLYAAMLVKTNRIHRIFNQTRLSARPPQYITPKSQLCITALLAGLQLAGSLIWLFFIPPGTRHIYPTRAEVVLTCSVAEHTFLYSLAYDAALIVLCTIYAVKTRKVPENFNETKFIGFSMYTTCVLWACWMLFFFGTGSQFEIQTAALCGSISMSANVALACIFSPKVYIILFEKHKNVRRQDGADFRKSYRSGVSDDNAPPTHYTALLRNHICRTYENKYTDNARRSIGGGGAGGVITNQQTNEMSNTNETSTAAANDTFL